MRKRRSLSDIEFVTAWAKAATLSEAIAATGMTRISAQARASKLRKAGVKLRRFGRPKKTIDVKGLNDLLRKLKGHGQTKRR
jgi:hypothetical protein